MGGRYISTDNAYVGAQKVLITPDISGKISSVVVHEGQHVSTPATCCSRSIRCRSSSPCARRRASSTTVRTDFANLEEQSRDRSTKLVDLAQKTVELKQKDVDRKIDAGRQPHRLAVRPRYLDGRAW